MVSYIYNLSLHNLAKLDNLSLYNHGKLDNLSLHNHAKLYNLSLYNNLVLAVYETRRFWLVQNIPTCI